MTEEPLVLIEPTAELESEYRAFLGDFVAIGQGDQLDWSSGSDTDTDPFDAYLARVREARGRREDQGGPDITYWLMRGPRIVGTGNLRQYVSEAMRDYAGHIGYCVRPSERRKRYGTRMLTTLLQKAAGLGIDEALLTTGYDNPASQGVIENNGGRLISESYSVHAKHLLRRYLVPTRGH
jgi:predicted acetyltransferase